MPCLGFRVSGLYACKLWELPRNPITPFKGVIPITPCVSYVVFGLGVTVVLHVYAFSLARKLAGKRECNLQEYIYI